MSSFEKLVANDSLRLVGLSPARLAASLAGAGLALLLIFTFIFLGIAGFTTGTSFGAVINSIIPAAAGLGMSIGSGASKADTESATDAAQHQLG